MEPAMGDGPRLRPLGGVLLDVDDDGAPENVVPDGEGNSICRQ
jgi:hypothetical protein